MEYAGAVQVDPPIRVGAHRRVTSAGWTLSHDGRTLRPRANGHLDGCLAGLRRMIAWDGADREYAGVFAVYDPATGELVTVTVRDGRVTRRSLRRPTLRERSNVVDLATRRRSISRPVPDRSPRPIA